MYREILNLEKNKDSKVFSGRDKGENARKLLRLNERDIDDKKYLIAVPDVYSINVSFFLGCFGESVRKLKYNGFKDKYLFKTQNKIIDMNIEDGILRALRVE